MFSKRISVIVGLVGSLLFLISLFAREIGLCSLIYTSCQDIFNPIAETLIIFIPFLLFATGLYFMQTNVYMAWLKFAIVWIPISIVAVAMTPEYGSSLLYTVDKSIVAFLSLGIFTTISSGIIFLEYVVFRLRR